MSIDVQIPPGTPPELERRLRELAKLLLEVDHAYRWAFDWANFQSSTGGEKVIVKGEPNDPTGNLALSRQKARRALKHAVSTVDEAISALRSALYTLDHTIQEVEPQPVALAPALVTRADLAASREAKQRRELDGRGWGEA